MYEDYTEADYAADREAGQLDAWEHAHPGNYAPLTETEEADAPAL